MLKNTQYGGNVLSGRKLSLTQGDHVDWSIKHTEHQQNITSKRCHWKIRSFILAPTGAQGVRMCVRASSRQRQHLPIGGILNSFQLLRTDKSNTFLRVMPPVQHQVSGRQHLCNNQSILPLDYWNKQNSVVHWAWPWKCQFWPCYVKALCRVELKLRTSEFTLRA